MVIMLYFHCKIVNNYPGPNPGLGPRVNPGFGFEKPAGYPGLRGPGVWKRTANRCQLRDSVSCVPRYRYG